MVSTKKPIIYTALIMAVCLVIFALFKYITSFQTLTVHYKNAHNIQIYKDLVAEGKDPASQPIKKVTRSGQMFRLKKGDYLIHYTGNSGYSSLFISVPLFNKKREITIDPDYTAARNDAILNKEFSEIKSVLEKAYPNISLYDIEKGKLYDKGRWYGTVLVYKNQDSENSDSLRVVLKKQDGRWVIKTNPPSISLDKETWKNIPYNILDDINSM